MKKHFSPKLSWLLYFCLFGILLPYGMQESDDNNFQKENENLKNLLTFTQNKLKLAEKSYDDLRKNYEHSVAVEKEKMNRYYERKANKYKGKVVQLSEQLKQISPDHNTSPSIQITETESPKLVQSKSLDTETLSSTPVVFSPTKDSLLFDSDDDQLIFLSKENEQLRKEIQNSQNLKAFKEKQNQIEELKEQTRILVELVEMYKNDVSQYRTSIENIEIEKKREGVKMKELEVENKKQNEIINNLRVVIESYTTEIESLRKSLIKQKLQFAHRPNKIFQSEIELQRSKSALENVLLKSPDEELSERLLAFQISEPESAFNKIHEPLSSGLKPTENPIPMNDVTFGEINLTTNKIDHEKNFQNPKKLYRMENKNLDIGLLKKKFSNQIQKLKDNKEKNIYTEYDLCHMLQNDLTFSEFQELCADKKFQNELLRPTTQIDSEKEKLELKFKQERERIEKENAQLKSELSVLDEKSKMVIDSPKEEDWLTNSNLWTTWNKRI